MIYSPYNCSTCNFFQPFVKGSISNSHYCNSPLIGIQEQPLRDISVNAYCRTFICGCCLHSDIDYDAIKKPKQKNKNLNVSQDTSMLKRYPRVAIEWNAWCSKCPSIGRDGDNTFCKITMKNFGESPSPAPDKNCPYLNDMFNDAVIAFINKRPQIRELLMKDIIEELERRKTLYPIPGDAYSIGKVDAFNESIDLIKNGVKKL
jgi:hypothetical protein